MAPELFRQFYLLWHNNAEIISFKASGNTLMFRDRFQTICNAAHLY